jgi:hypothetical protein
VITGLKISLGWASDSLTLPWLTVQTLVRCCLVLRRTTRKDSRSKKTHFGTEVGNCLRTIDRERLTFLAQCDGAHAKRTNQSQSFRL